MAGAVAWMRTTVTRPVAPVVFASDVRTGEFYDDHGAYGIVAADLPDDLAVRCFTEGMQPGYSVTRLDGTFSGLRRPSEPWRATKPLSRLPQEVFHQQE